jgi:transcriptional regulator with GAF, ATPase, and Fis domain
MASELRKSGIAFVGDMLWGTHFCQFYESKNDLLEVLVPYFKAGLENNETCLWIVSTLSEQEAADALRDALPDFDRFVACHNLEIFSDTEWYMPDGSLALDRVKNAWREKVALALASGHSGLRVSGDTFWLKRDQWDDFNHYEDEINRLVSDLPMTCLCNYSLAASGASDVLDVTRTHQFTFARRKGIWEIVETSELKQAKSEIERLNGELEQRVIERTRELSAATEKRNRAFEEIDKLRRSLESENEYLREEVRAASGDSTILGISPAIRGVIERIDMVAPTDATVLILGETGVGKELVARNIHERSPRRDRPLVKVNCTAIPRELFESEFFGHVKGAYSGAFRDRVGRFQRADSGSLFLDEVGDLPLEMQPKLLRVLQDGEFDALGDDKPRRANFRMIAASNRDLKAAVANGQFRQDLYYRLSVFPIEVPPLRERKEDIPILAEHFLKVACKRLSRPDLRLTESEIGRLQSYDWPGNVRELQNAVERAAITARDGAIHFDIAETIVVEAPVSSSPGAINGAVGENMMVVPETEMRRMERENIVRALKLSNGRIYGAGGAAELLGVKPSTLSTRIRKLGLR